MRLGALPRVGDAPRKRGLGGSTDALETMCFSNQYYLPFCAGDASPGIISASPKQAKRCSFKDAIKTLQQYDTVSEIASDREEEELQALKRC